MSAYRLNRPLWSSGATPSFREHNAAEREGPWDNARRVTDNRVRAMCAWVAIEESTGIDRREQIGFCRTNLLKCLEDDKVRLLTSRHYHDDEAKQFDTLFALVGALDPSNPADVRKLYEHIKKSCPRSVVDFDDPSTRMRYLFQ